MMNISPSKSNNPPKANPLFRCAFCDDTFKTGREFILHKKQKHLIDLRQIIINFKGDTESVLKIEKSSLVNRVLPQLKYDLLNPEHPEPETIAEGERNSFKIDKWDTDFIYPSQYVTTVSAVSNEQYSDFEPEETEYFNERNSHWSNSLREENEDNHQEYNMSSPPSEEQDASAKRNFVLKKRAEYPGILRKEVNGKVINICKFCKKEYLYLDLIKIHLRSHTGEKPYGCLYCRQTFAQKSSATIHERRHTGERPCLCSRCGEGFISFSAVHYHKKSNKCSSPSSSSNNSNINTCTDDIIIKPFTNTPFNPNINSTTTLTSRTIIKASKVSLKVSRTVLKSVSASSARQRNKYQQFRHCQAKKVQAEHPHVTRKLVNGIIINYCKFCKLEFKNYYVARRHTLSHTGGTLFTCSPCGKSFTYKQALRRHERNFHKMY